MMNTSRIRFKDNPGRGFRAILGCLRFLSAALGKGIQCAHLSYICVSRVFLLCVLCVVCIRTVKNRQFSRSTSPARTPCTRWQTVVCELACYYFGSKTLDYARFFGGWWGTRRCVRVLSIPAQ